MKGHVTMAKRCVSALIGSLIFIGCAEPRDMVKRSEFEVALSENARLLKELTEAKQKREELSADLVAVNNQAEELKLSMDNQKQNADGEIESLKQQLQIASKDLEQKKEKVAQLEAEVKTGSDNLEVAKNELEIARKEAEDAGQEVMERESIIAEKQGELEDSNNRLQDLKNKYQIILAELEKNNIEIDPELLNIESAGTAISDTAVELNEANDDLIRQLNEADAKLSLVSEEFKGEAAEQEFIRLLQLKINEGEAGLQTASQHLADAMVVISYLQEDRDRWKQLAIERQTRIAELEAEVKALKAQVSNLEKQKDEQDNVIVTLR
jgi:chromosome segregation ATPase